MAKSPITEVLVFSGHTLRLEKYSKMAVMEAR